jgi:hypothetical protein
MLSPHHKVSALRISGDYPQSRWMDTHSGEMTYFTSLEQSQKSSKILKEMCTVKTMAVDVGFMGQ